MFEALGLSPWLQKAANKVGITEPSEVQKACIPQIIAGKDCIATSQTGSGKTAAFALPILNSLAVDPFGIYCLVLTPTRELAFQIAEQFRVFGRTINLKLSVIVGGMDMMQQGLQLNQRPHILVCTPGRLADHINSGNVVLNRIKYLVLDEADRLLTAAFMPNLQTIFEKLPKGRQTLLFTATMTEEIEDLGKQSSKMFKYTNHSSLTQKTPENLLQQYIFVPSSVREANLVNILRNKIPSNTSLIIFTSKSRTSEVLRVMLQSLNLRCTSLHSQMSQPDRLSALAKFKGNIVPILICTDVASRGLDIPAVNFVINYELPASSTDYIHRIGRTGRAGRKGTSISICTERDIDIFQSIETATGVKMTDYYDEGETDKAIVDLLHEVSNARRAAALWLLETKFGEKRKVNREKSSKHDTKKKHFAKKTQ